MYQHIQTHDIRGVEITCPIIGCGYVTTKNMRMVRHRWVEHGDELARWKDDWDGSSDEHTEDDDTTDDVSSESEKEGEEENGWEKEQMEERFENAAEDAVVKMEPGYDWVENRTVENGVNRKRAPGNEGVKENTGVFEGENGKGVKRGGDGAGGETVEKKKAKVR
eukprot:comp17297_c1_seq1/m.16435 comp17297_c1_seq1/g.16435  ORF comp17297_c1_seq1/g.16435 comp17297_c1_seq1/m.16435 type:complete len:165 (-) comp17297_c1_seq1:416-910(-)